MKSYDRSDTSFTERTSRRYENWLALEDFKYSHRVRDVTIDGKTAAAVMFQKTTYRQYDLPLTEINWKTFKLNKEADDWEIVAEDERVYARPSFTDLTIVLDQENNVMQGKAVITIDIVEGGEDNLLFALNRGLNVTSITKEGDVSLEYEQRDGSIIVPWHTAFKGGETPTITVSFDGSLFNETEALGYSQVNIGPQGSFASWVTNWYPRLSGSFTKSRGRISYRVPPGLTVASCGRLVKKESVEGQERHVFEVNAPLDYSFAVADYFHSEKLVDDIAIGVCFIEGDSAKARLYVDNCARIIRYLKNLYGMYPFDSYSIVEIPSDVVGNLGGSSEQGMNLFPAGILAEDSFNLPLFAHEIGHSWWGNWVLSADGAVIDEGLAQMTAVFCVEEILGQKSMRDFLKNGTLEYPQSARLYFLNHTGDPAKDLELGIERIGKEGILHSLADVKGHFVYNMLREMIGHDAFVEGLQNAIAKYTFERMKLEELREEWEKASGKDLRWFFDQWFYRKGAPEFSLHYTIEPREDAYRVSGTVKQLREFYKVDAELVMVRENDREIRTLGISDKETQFEFIVPGKPDDVLFDPDYKIFRWTEEFTYLGLLGEGANLRAANRNEEAVDKLTQFLDKMPDHLEGHYQIGRAYQNLERHLEAKQHYERVVEIFQETNSKHWSVTWSYVRLGQICDETGQQEEATRFYNEVLALPDVFGSHVEARKHMEGMKD